MVIFPFMWPRAVFSAGGHDYISAGKSVTFPFLKTTEGKKIIRFSSIDSYRFIQMEAIYVKKNAIYFWEQSFNNLVVIERTNCIRTKSYLLQA